MLYGVKIRNKKGSIFEDNILFFENRDKAVQFEKQIRFLDDIVHKEDYKKKVEKIKIFYTPFMKKDNRETEIELINEYPILVEFF